MNDEIIEALESVTGEELDKEEIAAIEKALEREDIAELEKALSVFIEREEDLPDEVNEAASTLAKLVEKLALKVDEQTRGEEEEEEEKEKKVKKSEPWSFTLGQKIED